jgi:endonuclease YncB( thermonuclease family)
MGSCISCSTVIDNSQREIDKLNNIKYGDAVEKTYNFTHAKVVKVYDGDTFTIVAYDNDNLHRFQVRLYGINCEEIKDKNYIIRQKAYAAKQYVENLLLNKVIDIEILNNKIINGKKVKEKYGRLLANVKINGIDPAKELLKKELAREYYGGFK